MIFLEETDVRFDLLPSTMPNAGLGCFANKDLKKDDHVEIIGVYVKRGSTADKCTAYANRYKFSGDDDQETYIVPMGYGGMINHTDDKSKQNVWLEFVPGLAKRSQHCGQVIYRFMRNIKAGEELLGYYGVQKDKEIKWFNDRSDYNDKNGSSWNTFTKMNFYDLKVLEDI